MQRNVIDSRNLRTPRLHDYFGMWAIDNTRGLALFNHVSRMNLQLHVAQTESPKLKSEMITTSAAPSAPQTAIALIPISGCLMKQVSSLDDDASSTVQIRRDIRAAANDSAIGAILLLIDSPGGTVAGTADVGADIIAARAKKPVYAFAEDLCASAAYWIASQCDKVVANDATALIGSIGTLIALYDLSKWADAEGIEAVVIASEGSEELKGTGFEGAKIKPEQRAYLQDIVNNTQKSFDKAVTGGRKFSAAQLAKVKTGGVFMASEAMSLGLIDGIQTLDQTIEELMQAATQRTAGSNARTAQEKTVKVEQNGNTSTITGIVNLDEPGGTLDANKETGKPAAQDGPKTGKDFMAAFGQQGAVWFAEGKTFDEARDLHGKALHDENERLKAENKQLQERQLELRGVETPVSASSEARDGGGSVGSKSKTSESHERNYGPALAKVAQNLRFANPSTN